ncbi:hypothetical protein LINPERPRIM_LOCUS37725 [Linum perenne]
MKPRTENVTRVPKIVRVTQVDDNDMIENVDVEVEALKSYILHAKDEWKTTVIDFGTSDYRVQAAQMAEFLSLKSVCTQVVDCYGYALNWLAADHEDIKKWIFPLSLACTFNIKKPLSEDGAYGRIAEREIHGHTWMRKYDDISSSCELWCFPILHADHYSMFILNMKDEKYHFFDSRRTTGFEHQLMTTRYRVMKYVMEYLFTRGKVRNFCNYKWETVKGIRQRHGSSFCGDYLMRMFEKWDGEVRSWMDKQWKNAAEIQSFREIVVIEMFANPMNKRSQAVLEIGMVHYTVNPSQLPTPR